MPEVAGVFRRPFAEQVAAFRLRLGDLVPTSRWDDIRRSAHDRAFMVAGATKADLLADLGAAVDTAIAEGTGLEAFKRDFRDIVERHGWHGWTGEGTPKGEAWRMRTIYRTNMRTSYMAGRHAQLTEGRFKFWVYRHGGSVEPRLHHLGWDGLILPPDHPFWATHYPPNGWGCSCRVFGARSLAGAKRRGGDPSVELGEGWDRIDAKTGTPKGIGKGWDYAPGGSAVETVLQLRDKLDALPEAPSIDLIQSWLSSSRGLFRDWLEAPEGSWPLVRIKADEARAIGSQRRIAEISAETARKQRREHPELTDADYQLAQRTVSEATHRIRDSDRSLIFLREDSSGHVLVVKATKSGQGLFVTSFRRISGDPAERARLIRQFLRRGQRL